MADMVERVARAMLASDYPEDIGGEMEYLWWDRHGHTYLRYARASIEAMREPTDAMLDEGHNRMDFDDSLAPDADQFNRSVAGRVFTAMIDAALKETP